MKILSANYHIKTKELTTYKRVFRWLDENKEPIDLTGYNAYLQVKKTKSSEPIINASTDNEKIEIVGEEGKIILNLDAEDLIEPGKYKYDLLLTTENYKKRLLGGIFEIEGVITKL